MIKVKIGDTVKVHFVTKLEDGTILDSSPEETPFQFIIEEAKNLAELENAVIGMSVGESKTLIVPPEKAYGKYDESLVVSYPRESLPDDFEIDKGQYYVYENEEHEIKRVKVKEANESTLFFDFNHPLAGKKLYFDIKLLEILLIPQ